MAAPFLETCQVPLVQIDNLSMAFRDNLILRDISEQICDIPDHGQVVSIMGPSGVGKTTLLKALAGLYTPTEGEVLVHSNGAAAKVKRGQVGFVTQDYMLFEHLTVWDNLELAAKKKNGSSKGEIKDCIETHLNQFGLWEHRRKYPTLQLSGGQRQRVAIIQQLLCSEHYIILDEPFSGLDPRMKNEVCDLLMQVADLHGHNTLIIVTHDTPQAVIVSDTIWMMGWDTDPDGNRIPGARIVEKLDMIARGLAWGKDIRHRPAFLRTVMEIDDKIQ